MSTITYLQYVLKNICRYQPPNLAISTLYWKAWLLLLVVASFNPQKIGAVLCFFICFLYLFMFLVFICICTFFLSSGLAAWDGYPTLKMLMEMVMTK